MHPESHLRLGVTYPTLAELKLLTNEQLMVQLLAGVNDALAVLFERRHRLVFSIALKIVRDRGEAEDVMQNVFLEIFRSVAQFNPAKATTQLTAVTLFLLGEMCLEALGRKTGCSVSSSPPAIISCIFPPFRALLRCPCEPHGSTTTVLSAGQAKSTEFVAECPKNIQALGAVAHADEQKWAVETSETDFTRLWWG